MSDTGNHDVICDNHISGAGYAPRDATSTLPNPPPPAFVRPVDIVSIAATAPKVYGNTYDGKAYQPSVTGAASRAARLAGPRGRLGHAA